MAFDPQRRNLINAIFRNDKPCIDASDFLSDHFLRFRMFVAMNIDMSTAIILSSKHKKILAGCSIAQNLSCCEGVLK